MGNFTEWSVKIGLALLAVLSPVKSIMIAALFLIIMDFITGIWAALKLKEEITSFKMRRTIVKCVVYQLAIIVAFVMETFLLNDIPLAKVIGALIAITEGKSFFENVRKITGTDFWALILSKIQGTPLDEMLKKAEDKKEE